MKTLVAYVPVLHEGYRRFFTAHEGPKELYLVGQPFIDEDKALAKDIRQLDPALMQKAIESLGIFERVAVADAEVMAALADRELVLPDEAVSRTLAERYFANAHVTFEPIFLRWDKHNALKEKPVVPDEMITRDEFHRRVMAEAHNEAARSSDNWRHVGGAVVKDGAVVLVAHNRHVPSEHTPYVNGDPRSSFSRGINIEISSAFHAEVSLIAEAAKRGIALLGADMYVTTFPCPPCAKAIAHSGIKTLYCGGGYGVLDGEDILKGAGVRIVFVE